MEKSTTNITYLVCDKWSPLHFEGSKNEAKLDASNKTPLGNCSNSQNLNPLAKFSTILSVNCSFSSAYTNIAQLIIMLVNFPKSSHTLSCIHTKISQIQITQWSNQWEYMTLFSTFCCMHIKSTTVKAYTTHNKVLKVNLPFHLLSHYTILKIK